MTPTIDTERLFLRPFALRDARRVSYLAGEYDVARMCARVPHPYPLLIAEGWIEMQAGVRAKGEEFPFAITLARDGLIGACGVVRMKDADDVYELGYWLGRPYWGLGYASEAAAAVMSWARDTLGARVFTAGHFADNPASGHVLRKLGFVRTGTAELFGLARGGVAPAERYEWPDGARTASLDAHAHH